MRIRLILLTLVLGLAGCASTGHRFDASRLAPLTPGVATFNDVANALGAPPTQVYRQTDGSYTARWSHKTTFVTDGFYADQSVSLAFSADHRLQRLVDSNNILLEPWARTRLLCLTPPPQPEHPMAATAPNAYPRYGAPPAPAQITPTMPASVPPAGVPNAASVAPGYLPEAVSIQTYPITP